MLWKIIAYLRAKSKRAVPRFGMDHRLPQTVVLFGMYGYMVLIINKKPRDIFANADIGYDVLQALSARRQYDEWSERIKGASRPEPRSRR